MPNFAASRGGNKKGRLPAVPFNSVLSDFCQPGSSCSSFLAMKRRGALFHPR